VPILATRLKQTMLLMNPAFNEANFGYAQFKVWLEDNRDLAHLFIKDLQLYVAPADYTASSDLEALALRPIAPYVIEKPAVQILTPAETPAPPKQTADVQYKQVFARLKMSNVDLATRRDVLRDIYREVNDHPGEYTAEAVVDILLERYEAQGLVRSQVTLREIVQLALRQEAFDFRGQAASFYTPLWLTQGIDSEARFVGRAESEFLYAVIRAELEINPSDLAYMLLNDPQQVDYIQYLLDDLKQRGLVIRKGKQYTLPGRSEIPFEENPALQILIHDIEQVQIPDSIQPGVESAKALAKKAMLQRSQDFAASSNTYLLACRLQWDAVQKNEPGATLDDLRWYMASYGSAIAGKLSQVNRDYASARPYYLAFFSLVQEEDPLWSRMRGLINPMLAYYWSNTGRELDINVSAWNLSMASPAQIAVYASNHPNPDLRKLWNKTTVDLAQVNPGLLHRISNQLMLSRSEYPENGRVAEQIEAIIASVGAVAVHE
jgi:hypothetical protein